MVAIEAGTPTARIDGEPEAAWLMDPGSRLAVPDRLVDIPSGHGLTISGDVATTYRNETDRLATLLLLTVAAD